MECGEPICHGSACKAIAARSIRNSLQAAQMSFMHASFTRRPLGWWGARLFALSSKSTPHRSR